MKFCDVLTQVKNVSKKSYTNVDVESDTVILQEKPIAVGLKKH